ncbi:MAG TPA: hypothetical protein VEY69_10760 [Lautropia sp.]|nr:hypothetical protein [Lautropia sp.]
MAPLKALPIILLATACATASPAPAGERYFARGQEPGWTVTIAEGRMDYVGDYGETRLSVPRPDPRPSFNGLRYETPRLTVDVTYVRCNDAMSGHGYAHQVLVTADSRSFSGCGGERRPDWDN